MERINETTFNGKVIFWQGAFGFIETQGGDTFFFHKSNLSSQNQRQIRLLDEVSFRLGEVSEGKHKGQKIALDITMEQAGNLSDYVRHIGKLKSWNGKHGYIETPQQEKVVTVVDTRKLNKGDILNEGDLVVFHQVRSHTNPNQLFALFFYPIKREQNIKFLKEKYEDSHIEEINQYIDQLLEQSNSLTPGKKFKLELQRIGFVDNHPAYQKLLHKIKESQAKGYVPSYEVLKVNCSEIYMIQLWEAGHITVFEHSLIERYFYNATAETKRVVIQRLPEANRRRILRSYFERLKSENKTTSLGIPLKTLLDIVYRNQETRDISVYQFVKEHLLQVLRPEELVSLWHSDYLDDIPEDYILSNLDIDNPAYIKSLEGKGKRNLVDSIRGALEKYFDQNAEFDSELHQLVHRLNVYAECFCKKGKLPIMPFISQLSCHQKYQLWVFRVNFDFDATVYLVENYESVNVFDRLLFFTHPLIDKQAKQTLELLHKAIITQDELELYATHSEWGQLKSPTITSLEPTSLPIPFLDEVQNYIERYPDCNIDVESIACKIYNVIPKYEVHHLRLWLHGWVGNDKFDYVGFRGIYNQLTQEEKKAFRKKGDQFLVTKDVVEPEAAEVEFCTNVLTVTDTTIVYGARLVNMYFSNDAFILRTRDGSFTNQWHAPMASSGLNRISKNSSLNLIEVKVEVSNENNIIGVVGLDDLFVKIHTDEIRRVLGVVSEPLNARRKTAVAYTEDWNLRRQILSFLSDEQMHGIEPMLVHEPKNLYRRLDAHSGINSYELTTLFSIEVGNEIGIVWENNDLSDDRATYNFKSTIENHAQQLRKIADAIASYAQFRSALSKKVNCEELGIFKANFGYVASIKKSRGGSSDPLKNWKRKLYDTFKACAPQIPTSDELNMIESWSPDIPHTAKAIKIPKRIKQSEIGYVNMDMEGGTSVRKSQELEKEGAAPRQEALLRSLISFNEYFLKDLTL